MGVVIGIDVGGSTTKIVGVENKSIQSPMFVKATDPVTSLFGAFGKYIYDNGITLPEIEMVMLTGVGSAFIDQPLYGLPTAKTDEFLANGLGAKYAASLEYLIVVSMGTGTSFVKVEGAHLQLIAEMARKGTLTNIDLQIQDICNRPLPDLPLDATASNFGKADGNASPEDIASGIIHMVLQSIGQAAILSALNSPIRNFVLIGNLTQLPQCKEIFPKLEEMYGVRFLIPKYSEYRTAIGAALTYMDGAPIHPIK